MVATAPREKRGSLQKRIQDRTEALARQSHLEFLEMSKHYNRMAKALESSMQRLEDKMDEYERAGKPITKSQMVKLAEYTSMIEQTKERAAIYKDALTGGLDKSRLEASKQGIVAGRDLTEVQLQHPETGEQLVSTTKLGNNALNVLATQLADGSPVSNILAKFPEEIAQSITDVLLSGIASGRHPAEMIASIKRQMGSAIAAKTATLIHTETFRAFREGKRQAFESHKDLLNGWTWFSLCAPTTCAACWAMHGTLFEADEPMGTHPNCRCDMVPKTKSWADLGFPGIDELDPTDEIESGVSRFDKQPEATKQRILGPKGYAAYKSGAIRLQDLVATTFHPVWGTVRSQASVRYAESIAFQRAIDSGARNGLGDIAIDNETMDLLRDPNSVSSKWIEPDGKGGYKWKAERQALHDRIIREFTDGVPVKDHPTVYMLGGGPAAGKSTMLKSGKLDVPDYENRQAVEANPDLIKERIPEYDTMVANGDTTAAAANHEESSYLSKRLWLATMERSQDLVVDGLGKNYDKVMALGRPRGYGFNGYFATVPVDEAIRRALARAKKTGRFVPESEIRKGHETVSRIFADAAKKFDKMVLYDTQGASGQSAILIGQKTPGQDFKIVDQARYDTFQKIGNPNYVSSTVNKSAPPRFDFDTAIANTPDTDALDFMLSNRAVDQYNLSSKEAITTRPDGKPIKNTITKMGPLAMYAAGAAYSLNAHLRDIPIPSFLLEHGVTEYVADSPAGDRMLASMDKIMEAGETPDDMVLYRGGHGYEWRKFLRGLKTGDVFSDNGFVSTSVNRQTANEFAGISGPVLEIGAPKGTKGVYIGDHFPDLNENQYEFVLARGQKFVVVGTSKDDFHDVTRVEILPDVGPVSIPAPPSTINKSAPPRLDFDSLVLEGEALAPLHDELTREFADLVEQDKAIGEETGRQPINEYQAGGNYALNAYLRGMKNPTGIYVLGADARASLPEYMDSLDSLMYQKGLPQDTALWRGTEGQEARTFAALLKPGQVFNDKGYVSTSLDPAFVNDAFTDKMSVIYRIAAPKGAPGFYIGDNYDFPDQFEYLLPASSNFLVRGSKVDDTGRLIVDVELMRDFQTPVPTTINKSAPPRMTDLEGIKRKFNEDAFVEMHTRFNEASNLSDNEVSAFSLYAETGSDVTNSLLRGFSDPNDDSDPYIAEMADTVLAEADVMSQTMARMGGIQNPAVSYRGMNIDNDLDPMWAKMKPGDVFNDPGFASTSLDIRKAREFAQTQDTDAVLDKSSYVLEIYTPAGFPAVFMTPPLTHIPEEKELLLDKGTTFLVRSRETLLDGHGGPTTGTHLVVEVIPHNDTRDLYDTGVKFQPGTPTTINKSAPPPRMDIAMVDDTTLFPTTLNNEDGKLRIEDGRITPDDIEALRDYTTHAAYEINVQLRTDQPRSENGAALVASLDSIFDRNSLHTDMALYRGVKRLHDDMKSLKPGDVFTDKGFVSTSVHERTPRFAMFQPTPYSADGKPNYSADTTPLPDAAMIRILAPQGSKALPLTNGMSTLYRENEVVIDRDSKFLVRSVVPDGYNVERGVNRTLIVLELLPDQPASTTINKSAPPRTINILGADRQAQNRAAREVDKAVTKQLRDAIKAKTVADGDIGALISYSSSGYRSINDALRNELSPDSDAIAKRSYERAAAIDRLMDITTTPTDAIAYRGVSMLEDGDPLLSLEVGQVTTDKGFVSTSLSKAEAEVFAENGFRDRALLFKVVVPAGSKAVYLADEWADKPHEEELLLPRNSKFLVRSIEPSYENDNGRTRDIKLVTVELLHDVDETTTPVASTINKSAPPRLTPDAIPNAVTGDPGGPFLKGGKYTSTFDAATRNWYSSLSLEQMGAISAYTQGVDDLNDFMRGKTETMSAERVANAEKETTLLREAIEKYPLDQDVLTYRGIRAADLSNAVKNLKPGDVMTDPGFASSSLDQRTAASFANTLLGDTEKSLMLTIMTPKGSKAAYLGLMSNFESQRELLHAPNTRMLVREVKDGDKYREMLVEVLPDVDHTTTTNKSAPPRMDVDKVLATADLNNIKSQSDQDVFSKDLMNQTKALFRDVQKGWTLEETRAIADYTYELNNAMNAMLRGTEATLPEKLQRNPIVVSRAVQDLTTAIDKSPEPRDIVLYRGIDTSNMAVDPFKDLKVGQVVRDRGFLSATENLHVAQSFGGTGSFPEHYMFRMVVPKGTPAIRILPMMQDPLLHGRDEYEHLMKPGTRQVVLSIEPARNYRGDVFENGGKLITVEILPDVPVTTNKAAPPRVIDVDDLRDKAVTERGIIEFELNQQTNAVGAKFPAPVGSFYERYFYPHLAEKYNITVEEAEKRFFAGEFTRADVPFEAMTVREAIQSYKGFGYKDINAVLRTGAVNPETKSRFVTQEDFDQKQIDFKEDALVKIALMDKLFDETALPRDLIAFRGIDFSDANGYKGGEREVPPEIQHAKPGDVWTDLGFQSTSLDEGLARAYSTEGSLDAQQYSEKSVLIEYIMPKGSKALWLGEAGGATDDNPGVGLSTNGEAEILINRGARMLVKEVGPLHNGLGKKIVIELLPPNHETVNKSAAPDNPTGPTLSIADIVNTPKPRVADDFAAKPWDGNTARIAETAIKKTFEDSFQKTLTADEIGALQDYQGENGNNYAFGGEYSEVTKRNFELISGVIEKSPGLAEDTKLYRGMTFFGTDGIPDEWLQPGNVVNSPQLVSTSFKESFAKTFINQENLIGSEEQGHGLLLEILAPAGTKGNYYTKALQDPSTDWYGKVSEYLLATNSKFLVRKVMSKNQFFTKVQVEIVPRDTEVVIKESQISKDAKAKAAKEKAKEQKAQATGLAASNIDAVEIAGNFAADKVLQKNQPLIDIGDANKRLLEFVQLDPEAGDIKEFSELLATTPPLDEPVVFWNDDFMQSYKTFGSTDFMALEVGSAFTVKRPIVGPLAGLSEIKSGFPGPFIEDNPEIGPFTDPKKAARVRIVVPAGTKAVFNSKNQIAIDKGGNFVVRSIKVNEHGVRDVLVELLPAKAKKAAKNKSTPPPLVSDRVRLAPRKITKRDTSRIESHADMTNFFRELGVGVSLPRTFDKGMPEVQRDFIKAQAASLQTLAATGTALPKTIKFVSDDADDAWGFADSADGSVTINMARVDEHRDANYKGAVAQGWWVDTSDMGDHTLIHESQHIAHYAALGIDGENTVAKQAIRDKIANGLTEGDKTVIRKEIGQYATSDGFETVAEIAAGWHSGKRYSDQVMAIYDKLRGPALPDREAIDTGPIIKHTIAPDPVTKVKVETTNDSDTSGIQPGAVPKLAPATKDKAVSVPDFPDYDPNSMEPVYEAQQFFKTIGVELNEYLKQGDDHEERDIPSIVEAVNYTLVPTVAEYVNRGGTVPPSFFIQAGTNRDRWATATPNYGGSIDFNTKVWADPFWRALGEETFRRGWHSVSDAGGPVIHELSHIDHYRELGLLTDETLDSDPKLREMFDYYQSPDTLTPHEKYILRTEVGQYASTNPLEAIAEIRTKDFFGHPLSPEVLAIYKKYKGPKLLSERLKP